MGSTSTNPYTTQTIPAGYNANPPADDGSNVPDNEVTWSKHLDKIGDVLKLFVENVNTAIVNMGAKTVNTDDDVSNQITGSLAFGASELTIAAGKITATRSNHTVDTQLDAATDDLDNIVTSGVADGAFLVLTAENIARVVTVKHEFGGAGQIHLRQKADFDLDTATRSLLLQRRGADWYEFEGTDPALGGYGLVSIQVFTASGTWTKPSALANGRQVNRVKATCIGGGGGGGAGTAGTSGGGGGGGGTGIKFIDVTGTASETVTVGTGGTAGTAGGNGGTGVTSSLGILLTAAGGAGGVGTGGSGGIGGVGSGGDYDIQGGGGGAGSATAEQGGAGGSTVLGGGSPGVSSGGGTTGGNYGGGASGGAGNAGGGIGADGIVIVEEFII